MNDEIKDFYTLDELRERLARKLSIDIQNERELNKVIAQLITDNHLTPFLEYKGLVSIPKNCTPFASYEITESVLEALKTDPASRNNEEDIKRYKYNPTLNSVKNLVKTFEHGYCLTPLGLKANTHAIFRLSPLSVSITSLGINIELEGDKPVAHIEKFIEDPIKNNDYEFLGYILYPADQVNTPQVKLNKTSKLMFSSSDIIFLLDEIDSEYKKSDKTTSSLSLVELNQKSSNINTRSQDPKLIAMLAILLSEKSPQFKHGDKPNRAAIRRGIEKLIDELQIDHVHTYGLEAPHKRIGECLKEFSDYFYTDLDKITIVTSK